MKKILGAALGNCVHVGGLHHFLKIAEAEGFKTISLGPAVSIKRIVDNIKSEKPDLVAISYRLTPEVAKNLFQELKSYLKKEDMSEIKLVFGGTPPAAIEAEKSGLFDRVFSGGESINEIKAYLKGSRGKAHELSFPDNLLDRIKQKYPYPLLRHHFGRHTVEETINGVRQIAEAGICDIISLGTDQNAQEFFFNPEKMNHEEDGAGGVPVRKPDDLKAIYSNSRTGNYPLLRCYAGTNDLLKWAEMSVETINNAWAAIPLCWYSVIDGRSTRLISEAIRENKSVMKWYAEKGIPVEVNESHQWSLRDAHDSLAVTMAFLAAYNAKQMGVKNYVSQFMFNTPPGTSPQMDIAKMLAKKEMIQELEDENFRVIREVRAGIAHFSSIPSVAQGQLAASALISLSLNPHILHVVGFSEGDHAVHADELIHSCNIVHGVLQNCLYGLPEMAIDSIIIKRKEELKSEAKILLNALIELSSEKIESAWTNQLLFEKAIKIGLLDAPHFYGNPHLCGKILTRLINGGWYAVDRATGDPIYESERTKLILQLSKGEL
jgi:methylmalonyl-CoA mutase cobalamin-binding subunit